MRTKPAIRRLVAVGVSTVLLLTVLGAAPASAWTNGCTPGYWKNHVDAWVTYTPGTQLDVPFDFPGSLAAFRDDTLMEALNYTGGPGLEGAARITLRAAVAALLNHEALGVYFPVETPIYQTNWALLQDRDTMLTWAAAIDYYNNLGCILN